jgi:uncharacterized protein (UPF0333 family)
MLQYFNNRRKKGQSTLEYAILVIIILAALLTIQVYIKRGIQGRLKSAADDIGDQFSGGNQNVISVMHTGSQTRETFLKGTTKSTLEKNEVTTESTNSEVINGSFEYWGN